MTKSHKLLVLVPPLLIGLTILLTMFILQHRENQKVADFFDVLEMATTTDSFTVTDPVPTSTSPVTSDSDNQVMCTMEAKMCRDGSLVGRQGPDCAFAACPSSQEEPEYATACELSQREVEACIEIYAPVCGQKQVQCITAPCPAIPTTYSNSCFACMDAQVLGYTEGACSTEGNQ